MKPCDNCSKKDSCGIVKFITSNCHRSPWDLDKHFYNNNFSVDIVSMVSGDLDSIVLECASYDPVKKEADYSYLNRRVAEPVVGSPRSKCGSCKGKCGK